jgi:hypothetical protein
MVIIRKLCGTSALTMICSALMISEAGERLTFSCELVCCGMLVASEGERSTGVLDIR